MRIQTSTKLVVDSLVFALPDGREGEAEGHKKAKAAIAGGARFVDIYSAPSGTNDWKLVRHYEQLSPAAYFRQAARDITRLDIAQDLQLPARQHAELLMDSIYLAPRGSLEIRHLAADMKPGEARSVLVRGVFSLSVSASRAGKHEIKFSVHPVASKTPEFVQMLFQAGSEKPGTVATTPHFRRAGRRRLRSLSR